MISCLMGLLLYFFARSYYSLYMISPSHLPLIGDNEWWLNWIRIIEVDVATACIYWDSIKCQMSKACFLLYNHITCNQTHHKCNWTAKMRNCIALTTAFHSSFNKHLLKTYQKRDFPSKEDTIINKVKQPPPPKSLRVMELKLQNLWVLIKFLLSWGISSP